MPKSNFHLIVTEIFYVLTGALVILVLLEIGWPRLVLNYFNINYLVVLWLIVGALIIFKNRS